MGICGSSTKNVKAIQDYKTEKDLRKALLDSGVLEDVNILMFIDKTKSNEWTGEDSFGG